MTICIMKFCIMKTYNYKNLNQQELQNLCQRPAIDFESTFAIVKDVLNDVKENGDEAVKNHTEKFDGVKLDELVVTEEEIKTACEEVEDEVKESLKIAKENIQKFHEAQKRERKTVETMPGVKCFRESRPIEKVGIYVPGGTAPLPSTVLMLAVPAVLAGCKEIVLCTPPKKDEKVNPVILYAAKLAGAKKIIKVGGAQAIAAMAYGTESVPKVYKIFGPGNQYVTAAKMLVSIDPDGAANDMPAGPSEVLVIADKKAQADFVAADLLSQAEHGTDSQSVLVCTDERKTEEILREVEKQLELLSRKDIARQALEKSFALIVENLEQAFEFSNLYAPEHLIVNAEKAEDYTAKIVNAGSVFLGQYTCESAGDYASGTNHTLPTYGYARAYSGVSLESFQKQVTFQSLSKKGVNILAPSVMKIAEVEGLDGHRRAMELRSQFINL